MKRRLLS